MLPSKAVNLLKTKTANKPLFMYVVLATVVAGILGISGALATTGSDDFGNTFPTSYSLSLSPIGDVSQNGTIEQKGDVDSFKFVSPFDGYLKIRMVASAGSSVDSFISFFDSKQVRLGRNDNGGGGKNAELLVNVTKNNTFYVQATSQGGTAGAYTLSLQRTGPLGTKPNIVLILSDDQSPESMPIMPFMGTRTDWYKFQTAYLNNSTCCPSRATILSGQWSHHTHVEATGGSPAFNDKSTLPVWLHNAGYRTALFGKYHLGAVDETNILQSRYIPPGWDEWYGWHGINNGEAYYNYTLNENKTLVQYGSAPQDYSTDVLAKKTVDFINRANPSTPFFVYFAPRGPHNPWIPAPRNVDQFKTLPIPKTPDYNEADVSDKPLWWQSRPLVKPYNTDGAVRKEYATLQSVDDAAKNIYQALNNRHMLQNTIIVYMTDNGYAFGQHRYQGKVCQYDECNRTPLLVWYPQGPARTIPQIVSNADIAPTFASMAGVDPGAPVDGHSFLPLITQASVPDWPNTVLLRAYHGINEADANVPTFWGIRTGQYKYIESVDTGETELYDMTADPYELQNQASNPAFASIKADLASKLLTLRTAPPH